MESIAQEYLGSGYDVFGEYADAVSVKKRIFDLGLVSDKINREFPNIHATYLSVKGESYQEYQSSLAAKAGLEGTYSLFSGSVKSHSLFSGSVKSSYSNNDLSIQESSFVSIKLFMRYSTYKLQVRSQAYIYPEVIEDFNKIEDGKWLIEHYGAAVLMGIDLGGQWSDNLTVSKLFQKSTSDVAGSMEAAYGTFVSGDGSAEITKTVTNEESIASRRVNVVGGDPKYAPDKLDDWQASVKESPAFMNFTPDGLVWIWDLFPEHKVKLKEGYDAVAKDNALNIKRNYLIKCKTVEGYKYTSDAGSGAKNNLELYKPVTSDSEKYVGVNGNSNKSVLVQEISRSCGAIREPTGWRKIWSDAGTGRSYDYNIWMPTAPPDYVAMGVYCRFRVDNQNAPSESEAKGLVVVHKSLVNKSSLSKVWTDGGIRAKYSVGIGRLPHEALWPSRTNDPSAGILPSMYTFKDEYMVKVKKNK